MKGVTINLYGEGTRIDAFQPDDDLCDSIDLDIDSEREISVETIWEA